MPAPDDHHHALPIGYRLGEYRIEKVLGVGGFGITYYAWDESLAKPVALKEYLPNEFALRRADAIVTPKSTASADTYQWGLDSFLKEGQALAAFQHRHLNQVHRYFEANGTAYLVLEYIEGETLAARLKREGQLPEAAVRRLLTELLDGLAEVHSRGYVHRDVKPGNIMLRTLDGGAVLLDFGAARQAIGVRSRNITVILTPGYAPIEQYTARAENVGPWSDLYTLGIVAYRAISGATEEQLVDAVTRVQLKHKGRTEQDLPPAAVVGKGRYAAALLQAVDWAIQPEESERPQNAAALLKAIDDGPPVPPKPPAPPSNPRRVHCFGAGPQRPLA